MVSENTMLKGKLCTLEDSLSNSELESKASRETITRLVAEVNNEQSSAHRIRAEIEALARVSSEISLGCGLKSRWGVI